jgi:hypothetical protein
MYGGNSPRQKGPRPEHAHPRMSAFTRAGGILHQETRKARRQRLARSLWESGPRPVLEALLEVEAGRPLGAVLERYARSPRPEPHRPHFVPRRPDAATPAKRRITP